jgi:hypothetical protein
LFCLSARQTLNCGRKYRAGLKGVGGYARFTNSGWFR